MFQAIKENRILVFFFAFLCLFPTLKFYISGTSNRTLFDFFISSIPDIFSVILFLHFYLKIKTEKLHQFDKLYLGYFLFSIIYGIVLSRDAMAIALGFRLSYLPMLFYFIGKSIYISSKDQNDFETKYLNKIFQLFIGVAFIGLMLYFLFPQYNTEMIKQISGVVSEYVIIRMTSILWSPVVFATFLSFAILFYCYRYFKNQITNKTEFAYIIIGWIALILTVSRGALVAFVISLILILIVFRNRRKSIRLIIWLIVFYILALALASIQKQLISHEGNYVELFYSLIHFTFQSTADTFVLEKGLTRVELWRRSWESFIQQPWGYGLGKSGHIAWRLFKDTLTPSSPYSTDGWYLKLLGETGIIGATFFLILVFVFVKQTIKNKLISNKSITTFLGIVISFTMIQNIVSNVFDYFIIAPLIYMMLGYYTQLFYAKES